MFVTGMPLRAAQGYTCIANRFVCVNLLCVSFTGAVQGIAFSKNGSAELVLGDGT